MNENRWRDLRRIKIRPIDIILAVLVILAFLFVTTTVTGETEAGEPDEEFRQQAEESEQEARLPIAGATAAIYSHISFTEAADDVSDTDVGSIEAVAEVEPAETIETESKPETDGFYIDEIPLTEQQQEWFWEYSNLYDCPAAFSIGTAEVETEFISTVKGAAGEVGWMQILPGPGGRYFEEGNIAAGCYLLGMYLNKYGDFHSASMAYNFGEARAKELWAQGVYSSEYSRKVYKAMNKWAAVIEDAGIELSDIDAVA